MPISWWIALLAAALVMAYPRDANLLTYRIEYGIKLWWLNWRMERMARRVYARLQRDHEELGLPPLPPFSWKALEDRYPKS